MPGRLNIVVTRQSGFAADGAEVFSSIGAALERARIDHSVHRYAHDPRSEAYGAEAVAALAETLGVRAEQIFKTLVIELSGGDRPGLAVAVVPVPAKLSLKSARCSPV